MSLYSLFSIFFLTFVNSETVKTFDLKLSKFSGSPDGFPTQILGFNSRLMNPIIVNRGDKVVVNIYNEMDEPTTVHYHGILQASFIFL
jgi:iron transport multicopper oxidase